ncbi:MAG: hypothetical protein ACE366_07240 [Bradymonadia bacterium]
MGAGKKLSEDPPRTYSARDARRDRPWRPAAVRVGVECVLIGGALGALGFATGQSLGLVAGGVLAGAGALAAMIGGNRAYQRWAELVQCGPRVQGRLGHLQPVVMLHELLKPAHERTGVLHYEYPGPDGQMRRGKVLICSCVRDRLPAHSEVPVIYHPDDPDRSVPLQLAVMVAHKK